MKKTVLSILTCLAFGSWVNAQNVNIPDGNFKNALLDHGVGITGFSISTIDTNGDGEIQVTEAQVYSGRIDVVNKNISDLTGIEAFENVTLIWCNNNSLTSLDVSANIALTHLLCHYNSISSLDVSGNSALTTLNCRNNLLTNLNIANGNNGVSSPYLYSVVTFNNPNLTCIQHDSGFDPTTANQWGKDATASWSTNCGGSSCTNIVNIPDTNFKTALLNHSPVIDTDGDGEICESEAQAFTGTLNVNNQNISDLTGFEAFVNTTILYCDNNQITSLNISANTALTELWCQQNAQLGSLDVSANTALLKLHCNNNIDLVSLNVSTNTALTQLSCNGNYLTSLDVSNNTALETLYCDDNELSSLDVSNNTALTLLSCADNQLSSLDVSVHTDLQSLDCMNNQLTSLNVANGNNGTASPVLYQVFATGNPNLSCIQHDTGFDPTSAQYWQKDATASWSDNCSASINENSISLSIVPNPTSGMVNIDTDAEINSVEIFSTSGQQVASFDTKAFDISALQSGVYFVKVLSDSGLFTTRIIKE